MKSLSFKEDQFLDLLMEISNLSEYAALTLFIENLNDLATILASKSQVVMKFLQTGAF